MGNISFVRKYKLYKGNLFCYDIIYKSNRWSFRMDDDLPKTARHFIARAEENGWIVEQYDKLFERDEVLYFDHPRKGA